MAQISSFLAPKTWHAPPLLSLILTSPTENSHGRCGEGDTMLSGEWPATRTFNFKSRFPPSPCSPVTRRPTDQIFSRALIVIRARQLCSTPQAPEFQPNLFSREALRSMKVISSPFLPSCLPLPHPLSPCFSSTGSSSHTACLPAPGPDRRNSLLPTTCSNLPTSGQISASIQ